MAEVVFTGQVAAYGLGRNEYLRGCGQQCDLSRLGGHEFFSFVLHIQNGTERAWSWKEACAVVDGGAPCRWGKGRIVPGGSARLHIAFRDMQPCCTPGTHQVVWYFDGRAVHQQCFTVTRSLPWKTRFSMPSREEIERYQSNRQSPYITAYYHMPEGVRFTEYMVDFRALHVPRGTYCCLGGWTMDHTGLQRRYARVRTEYTNVHGYAGFQKIGDGRMVSIMSFWDVYCTGADGKEITIPVRRLYPQEVIDGGRFWGEGTGERCSAPFDWEANHWYRMHLKCVRVPGTTYVEQWVRDLQTQVDTLLCRYDIGIENTMFMGSMAAFLENYLPQYAAQVRSMELRNVRYLDADTGRWNPVMQFYVTPRNDQPNYAGSYDYGVEEDCLWMVTSGVGGDWFGDGRGKPGMWFTVGSSLK